eukprot:CAMPEP_0175866982 /NCGR_PEP_ID=MMETSP0107_2-20121207/34542_1 /TAXON_ID=195067 ORGANISM="Goniomonas pacifica, Strain CCMP1869" /NCGR_SAMPLE_ID=MMETSP0107_2 /ASSEMBLY_ACC=CAM_ASM_000203 /LENGTH=68 /DNA_ID=CAMNT_0017184631 /DNA_START=155 /DNA_END=358 /DNA_ORIENTATION=+
MPDVCVGARDGREDAEADALSSNVDVADDTRTERATHRRHRLGIVGHTVDIVRLLCPRSRDIGRGIHD